MFRYTPTAAELCPGEYPWVASESRNLAALTRAHATPCTRAEAEALIRALARELLPAADAAALHLTWGSKRGRGGLLNERKREIRCVVGGRTFYRLRDTGRSTPYVSLPDVPMEEGEPWWIGDSTRLRVGLVLHEFAHVLAVRDEDGGHGTLFVTKLDALVWLWDQDPLHVFRPGGRQRS